MTQMNVYRTPITECSCKPMTGWHRDGTCSTEDEDKGRHVVCCEMTTEFLAFSRYLGNDLSTPRPDFGFPGLNPGDHWCLCLDRWKQALEAGCAPLVDLNATHLSALEQVSIHDLEAHEIGRQEE